MEEQMVLPAIKALLDEVDEVIINLNEEGALQFRQGAYGNAKALLVKAEAVMGFRGKLLCLEDDWKALSVPAIQKKSKKYEVTKAATPPLKKGLKTDNEEFRYPILEALLRMDGAGSVGEVLKVVEAILSDQLNQYDYQSLPSNPNSVRWKNTAQWQRYNMVQEGLLAADSPRGVWEITIAGREALRKAKAEPDLQRKLFGER
jgi:hypothetical protein